MATNKSFADYIVYDVFAHIPGISAKAMFGGFGLYKNGKIFGIITEDEVYFKVTDENKKDYEKINSKPFTYSKSTGKTYQMSYWLVPEDILEDKIKILEFINKLLK